MKTSLAVLGARRMGLGGVLLAMLVIANSRGLAQVANGTITGRVTDTTGAVLSGSEVTLTRSDTGLVEHISTNKDGIYSFASLQTGPFVIEVVRTGFKQSKTALILAVDQTAQVDVVLLVGGLNDSVTIDAANFADLDTQASTLAFTVGAAQVAELPLNGRNPYGLAALAPGIMPGGSFGAGVSTARGAVVAAATNNFQANGGEGGSNEILLDGVPIVVCCQGQPPLTPSVEVVDQFKVITSTPPAQFGRSSGGVLNLVTKTGTNHLHGDLYDFFRNDKLDAANYFTKRRGVFPIPTRHDYRLPHRYNQFGGFVSGPVFVPGLYNGHDKTFFTFGYEGTRNAVSSFVLTTVPTALMRQGDFTEAPALVYDPNNVATVGGKTVRQPLAPGCAGSTCYGPGRYVTRIDPVAAKILPLLPAPNSPGVVNNYSYSKASTDSVNQFNFRLDHNWTTNQRTFVRGTRDIDNHHENDLFNQTGGPNAINQALVAYLFALGHTWVVTPTFLLQATYGFGYQQNHQVPENFTNFNPGDYGFSSNFQSQQQQPGLPLISIGGIQTIGNSASANFFVHYTHTLGISATLQRGNHSLVAGYDGRYILENEQSVSNPLGTFSFDSALTNGPDPNASAPSGQTPFDSFAAFLLGVSSQTLIQRQTTIAFTQPYHAFFVQDDWRIRPNLTFNLGARYDLEMGLRERYSRWADFDPNATNPLSAATGLAFKGGAQFLGTSGNPNRTWQTAYKDVAPRVGFSYSPTRTTVARGGFGILFLPTSERGFGSGTLGFSVQTEIDNISTGTPTNTFSDPFGTGVALPAGPASGVQTGTGSGVNALLYNTPNPYQEQWNFGIEQQMQRNLTFTLNYAGSHGVKLAISGHPNDLNPKYFGAPGDQTQVQFLQQQVANPFSGTVTTGSLAAPTVQRVQLLSAFPQYYPSLSMSNSSLTYNFNGIGSASYNAMQAGLAYRKASGLDAAVFYTWSKLLGNVSDITNGFLNATGNPGIQNYYLIKQEERSNLATDVPHRVVGNFIYPLPFGRGQRFGRSMPVWADLAIGGWQLNGIGAVQSGYPLGFGQTGAPAFAGSRPTFVPGVRILTSGSTHSRLGTASVPGSGYLNPAAFRLSQSFELGNVPRSAAIARSPLTFQNDLSAIKNFRIHEAIGLQFRLEAFNVMNKVQFGFPNTTVNSSSFGVISSQANLPRNVQAALKLNF